MFQFPGFASASWRMCRLPGTGCPIRRSADQGIFAPPRGLSQLITSFVASESPGILHVPFSPFFMTLVSIGSNISRLALRNLFCFRAPVFHTGCFDLISIARFLFWLLVLIRLSQRLAGVMTRFQHVNVLFSSSPWQS